MVSKLAAPLIRNLGTRSSELHFQAALNLVNDPPALLNRNLFRPHSRSRR